MPYWSATILTLATVLALSSGCAALYFFWRNGGDRGFRDAVRTRLSQRIDQQLQLRLAESQTISAAKFGDIERDIRDLREVIVVAHCVENPQEALRAAVQDNFRENVKYTFVVSSSQFDSSAIRYSDFFEAIHKIAHTFGPKNPSGEAIKPFHSLFAIQALRGEWGSWPYVFYRFNGIDGTPLKIAGFRGDQLREGIAENYYPLTAADAQSIYNACEMGIRDRLPGSTLIESFEFEDSSAVVGNVVQLRA